jgi:hypothetical protein
VELADKLDQVPDLDEVDKVSIDNAIAVLRLSYSAWKRKQASRK